MSLIPARREVWEKAGRPPATSTVRVTVEYDAWDVVLVSGEMLRQMLADLGFTRSNS